VGEPGCLRTAFSVRMRGAIFEALYGGVASEEVYKNAIAGWVKIMVGQWFQVFFESETW